MKNEKKQTFSESTSSDDESASIETKPLPFVKLKSKIYILSGQMKLHKKIFVAAALFLILAASSTAYYYVSHQSDQNQDQGIVTDEAKLEAENQSPSTTEASPLPTVAVSGMISDDFLGAALGSVNIFFKNETTGIETKVLTDANGKYSVSLTQGTYSVSAQTSTHSLTSQLLEISESDKTINYQLKMSNPKNSQLTVSAYKDDNKNNTYENDEQNLDTLLTLYKESNGQWQKVQDIILRSGPATLSLDRGKYRVIPGNHTFFNPPSEKAFTVDGYGKAHIFSFAYQPTVSEGGITLYVFNDKNENSIREADEELIHYQAAHVTNQSTNQSRKYAVPPEGMEVSHLSFGRYFVVLVPDDASWDAYYRITDPGHFIEVTASGSHSVYMGAKKLY